MVVPAAKGYKKGLAAYPKLLMHASKFGNTLHSGRKRVLGEGCAQRSRLRERRRKNIACVNRRLQFVSVNRLQGRRAAISHEALKGALEEIVVKAVD